MIEGQVVGREANSCVKAFRVEFRTKIKSHQHTFLIVMDKRGHHLKCITIYNTTEVNLQQTLLLKTEV
jgi:hypothetical protein